MKKTNKRVLFLNPTKKGGFHMGRIHMGFTLLGQILTEAGCAVKLIDYAFLSGLAGKVKVPAVEEVVADFKPEIVGISAFTYLYDECQDFIERVSKCTEAPIMVGGPHVTLFPNDFSDDKRISYVVRGEAEHVIADIVADARREPLPRIIDSLLPLPAEIPSLNLDIAVGSEYLKDYQIQLSRGCPFNCSFCSIDLIAGRKVRPRSIDACLDQIEEAIRRHPLIQSVSITDDCPTFNRKRFKDFLKKFIERKFDTLLTIDNVRADLIDEEMLELYILAGGQNICLGTESGYPAVFKMVHKGESLDTIIKAAKLVRKFNLQLGLCFVIGLPEDTLERHRSSIALAKMLKPDYIFWNMCVPWPGTEIYEWFKKNGEIKDPRNFSTLIDGKINFGDPPAVTLAFSREDRIKAWLMAALETCDIPLFSISNLRNLPSNVVKLVLLAGQYRLYKSLFSYMREFVTHKMWYEIRKRVALHFLRKRKKRLRETISA
jgi:anaerobic magnesium-protoporphyrin IX monomethyl ester cyclase